MYITKTDPAPTSGIQAVENARQADNKFYNVAGQRVAQPAKGLYIVNGRKVLTR